VAVSRAVRWPQRAALWPESIDRHSSMRTVGDGACRRSGVGVIHTQIDGWPRKGPWGKGATGNRYRDKQGADA
jgi:hypothetical protein